jgi:large subunit ribosomal protein L18
MTGNTVAAAASTESALKPQLSGPARPGNKAGAQVLGKAIAERLIAKGIKRVVFDRGGFLYHGRIRAVAEAAREAGLEF